jgi:hypothetical protein
MPYKKKTWKEKLEDNKDFPKNLILQENFPCWRALKKMGAKVGDTMVLAPPLEIYELMNQVPEGKLQTLTLICEKLAEKHNVNYCCTLTTGIFVTISANAAEEMNQNLPYWRTIKNDGELNKKYPGGIEKQRELLEKEGHTIYVRGRKNLRYYIKNYDKNLIA